MIGCVGAAVTIWQGDEDKSEKWRVHKLRLWMNITLKMVREAINSFTVII